MPYTSQRNIQILISLLKQHGIRKVIASPGAMNINLNGSLQNDGSFEIFSCVDERSAAYMACGMAQESGEPVILTCTGATASRNYAPALTEAFYNKVPVLAITAAQHAGRTGHNIPQVLDRTVQFNDLVKKSVQIPEVNTPADEWGCMTQINDALLELKHNGGGPVHINLVTSLDASFNVKELPKSRKINRIELRDTFPEIKGSVCVFIGNHTKINKELESEIDEFCEKYNAAVLCDMTSNYYGKYRISGNIVCDQDYYDLPIKNVGTLIHLGNISGSYMFTHPNEVYRVNPDGVLRDTYQKLTNIFEMEEIDFFKKYNSLRKDTIRTTHYSEWKNEENELFEKINYSEIPFSNIWVAQETMNRIPEESNIHLGILNSLRSWNYCNSNKKLYATSNTGGFGIDGPLSTTIGASLCNPKKNYYCFVGDLAFFYDLNSLGNRHIGKNLRIMLINNGCGTEFHNYNHYAHIMDDDQIGKYVAADGHFGNKSDRLIRDYAENLGFKYLRASSKEEFLENVEEFVSDNSDSSIIFEIFTDSDDESAALKYIRNLKSNMSGNAKKTLSKIAKVIKRN
ncbi:2-succinyl-5-enolpyruvyl-6-hydroxy-3-cyclohexene-1-carboxylate synthase [Candidatus Saccharibacteria bacterium]|nr:2-succinyl-5-enolpyruvyl-6-hydroxy-3-cyclohexene-1-carboxylate synthase [Candidatus Saccharibacteria bacterium]